MDDQEDGEMVVKAPLVESTVNVAPRNAGQYVEVIMIVAVIVSASQRK